MNNITRIEIPTPFDVGTVNCYAIQDDELTIIDPGPLTNEAYTTLKTRLNQSNNSIRDIDRILITHPHIDHFGLVHRLAKETDATILAHTDAIYRLSDPAAYLDREQEFFIPFLLSMGVPDHLVETVVGLPESYTNLQDAVAVDQPVTDGDTINVLDGLQSVHTPGHAPGSVCYVSETHDFAFTGDHIMEDISPNPLLTISPDDDEKRTQSLPDYIDSLHKVKSIDVNTGYSGHRGVVADLDHRIDKIITHHDERKDYIAAILEENGPMTPYTVTREMFTDLPATELFAGMSEIIGHLDLLEQAKRVDIEAGDGVTRYALR